MEHLLIHLPYEAELGGPVQFRWMYGYERYFKYLKGKARNFARVEGSIVAGSLTEEISHFSSYYFPPSVRTRKRAPRRYDDGGVRKSYPVPDVPHIFSSIGRHAGFVKEEDWSSYEDYNTAHTYILLQCDEVTPFENEFVRQVYEVFPDVSPEEVQKRKTKHFSKWLRKQVDYGDVSYPIWFRELIQGPLGKISSSHIYCTRGYVFHTLERGQHRSTSNYGVVVRASDTNFYGIIQEIIEVTYPGWCNLKCTLFKCTWFDPVVGRGVRLGKFGVVDVNQARSYNNDPYVLASQADQVCFIPYPRTRQSGVSWLSVIRVSPRGVILQSDDELTMQNEAPFDMSTPEQNTNNVFLIDPVSQEVDDALPEADDEENTEEEFNFDVETTEEEEEDELHVESDEDDE